MAGRRAVFLDRDGVLNQNVFYEDTCCWESPRCVSEFRFTDGLVPALQQLRDAGFLLFLVSNQPNEAKGKSSPGVLAAMHALLTQELAAAALVLEDAFYCTHHPQITGHCVCRKPSPYFLLQAAGAHDLSLSDSWMVGDRATDMECGRAAGTRTAWVETGQERVRPLPGCTDIQGSSLPDVVRQILESRV